MNLIKEIKELVKKFDLIHQAKIGLKRILDNNTRHELDLPESDEVVGKMDSYSVVVNQGGMNILRIRLRLFIKGVPVGYYHYETDLNGVFNDEYFVIK